MKIDTQKANGILETFHETFWRNLEQATKSGAIADDDTEFEVIRSVLVITADYMAPRSTRGKKLLRNLRNFV